MKGEDRKLFFVLSVFIVAVASVLIIKNLCFAQSKQAVVFQSGEAFSEQGESNFSENSSEKSEVKFPIEINSVTKEQLMEIDGIGEKTASRIIDYRETKGRINSLAELLNVEGIGEKTLAKLKKYLYVLNEQTSQPNQQSRTSGKVKSDGNAPSETQKVSYPLEVNSVTKEQLMEIDGIGEKTASRIIDYRKTKGRINSLDELLNVEGIGEKTLANLKKYLYVQNGQSSTTKPADTKVTTSESSSDTPVTTTTTTTSTSNTVKFPVNINIATFDELMQIPKMTEEYANNIINHRSKDGCQYDGTLILLEVLKCSDTYYNDILQYITF